MAWIGSDKPIIFKGDEDVLRRGKEVYMELCQVMIDYAIKYGTKPPYIKITEIQCKEFLCYVRFHHFDKVKGLPAGFPTAGEHGVLFSGIPLQIIKPTKLKMS